MSTYILEYSFFDSNDRPLIIEGNLYLGEIGVHQLSKDRYLETSSKKYVMKS